MEIAQQKDRVNDLILLARETQREIKEKQAGVGTFFQLTLIRFMNTLEGQLDKFGSMEGVREKIGEYEFGILSEKLEQIDQIVMRRESGRFVDWATRMSHHGNQGKDRSEIGYFETLSSQGQFNCLTWKNLPLFKSAFDYAVLPMLMFELRPATIIELGSGAGASAIWLSDTAQCFNLKTHIYSLDIARPDLQYQHVTYLKGDCFQIEKSLSSEFLSGLPKPFLVIEDAHANVLDVLSYLHEFLETGDYFFIEDSGPKRTVLDEFMSLYGNTYRVDTHYTDLFGKNSVSAYDSIFKRI
ncbi:MAG: CmcI family methyltransferase [Bacteroidota bacterium]